MKLLEILKENISLLNTYLNNAAGPGLDSRNPGGEGTTAAVKEALSRHRLITGFNTNGSPQMGPRAWVGGAPYTDEWPVALDDAIRAWKRSINLQLDNAGSNASLDESIPYLRPGPRGDIYYLIQARKYPSGHAREGLLFLGTEGRVTDEPNRDESLQGGRVVDLNTTIDTSNYTSIQSTRDFVNAISYTGWWLILREMAVEKGLNPAGIPADVDRNLRLVYDGLNLGADRWLTIYSSRVLGTGNVNLEATLADGTSYRFIPSGRSVPEIPDIPATRNDDRVGERPRDEAGQAQALFLFFQPLAQGLIAKAARARNAANRAGEAAGTDAIDPSPVLTSTDVNTWVERMNQALSFDITAILPGGRAPDDDISLVTTLMRQLQTSGDWDSVAERWQQVHNSDLSATLVDNLNEQNYRTIVRGNLARILKIRPALYHSAINFANDEESVSVELDGTTYTVMKNTGAQGPVVKQGSNIVEDAILEDRILQAAVTQTGGTVPDINIQATDDQRQTAAASVVAGIEETAPEMVAFYTGQRPFNNSGVPNLGPARLNGIFSEATIMAANGANEEGMIAFVRNIVTQDLEWLIGDGTEENPGVAFIHFDPRYRDEGDPERSSNFLTTDDDDIEITDEIEDYVTRLESNPTEQASAINDIIQSDNPETLYDTVYRAFKRTSSSGEFLDQTLGSADDLLAIINGEGSESPLRAIVGSIGAARAAPFLMAELFQQSQRGIGGFDWTGTNDELAGVLVAQISNREEYDLVNERYRNLPDTDDDLIDDMASEQGLWGLLGGSYYNNLAAAIGAPGLDARRQELPASLVRRLEDAFEEPTVENLERLQNVINRRNFESEEAADFVMEQINELVQLHEAGLNEEQQEILIEIREELVEIISDLNEEFWDNRFYKRWYRSVSNWFNN